MSDSIEQEPASTQATAPVKGRMNPTLLKIIVGLIVVAILVIAYFIAAAVVPVEWAKNIASQAGSGDGVLLGFSYGFFLTLVSLIVAWQATHKKITWPYKTVILVLALVISTPNLLTASIAFGNSNAAHNGQRIIGTGPTWFPLWSGIGAITAAVIFIVGLIFWKIARRRGAEARAFRAQEKQRALEEKEASRARAAAEKAARKSGVRPADSPVRPSEESAAPSAGAAPAAGASPESAAPSPTASSSDDLQIDYSKFQEDGGSSSR